MKIFNMFRKHFKNFGNYTRHQFTTMIFGQNNESTIIHKIYDTNSSFHVI